MTEAEWLAYDDPAPMLEALRAKISDRKLRLFVCAICRRNEANITKPAFREALEIAERYADGLASDDERATISSRTALASHRRVNLAQGRVQAIVHWAVQSDESMPVAAHVAVSRKQHAQIWQARILRCLFGNHFRPVAPNPAWQTPSAVTLARTIYDERRFELLPLLADLLEEAGCPAEVSEHCRRPGEHVRGCWVVDFVLGLS